VDPRNHVLDGGPDPPWEGAILRGKGAPPIKYRDTLQSSVLKRPNRSRCHLVCGVGWPKESCVSWGPLVLRDVAMATNFGTQFAITGFVGYNFGCVIASLILGVGIRGQAIQSPQVPKGRCHGNQFWD